MLGLSASVNNEEGYAKGERYRERFHTGGTYHPNSNPLGRIGLESDWIGDFEAETDDDNFVYVDCVGGPTSGVLRVSENGSGTSGYFSVHVSAVPNVSYTLSWVNDPATAANGSVQVKVGNAVEDDTYLDTGAINDVNTRKSGTLTPTIANLTITIYVIGNGKRIFIDDLSFKEA